MEISEWHIRDKIICDSVKADIKILDNNLIIEFLKNDYSIASGEIDIKGLKKNTVYNITFPFKKENAEFKTIYYFYDENGKETEGGYIDNNRLLCLYDNVTLKLIIKGYSYNKGYIKVAKPFIEEIEPLRERNAVISAIPIIPKKLSGKERSFSDNIKRSFDSLKKVLGRGKIDMAVFTECFHSNGVSYKKDEGFLNKDCPMVKEFRAFAKKEKIYIVCPIHEKTDDNKLYNSLLLIDRNGDIVLNYHKIHLTVGEYDSGITPGDKYMVYDCDFGRVGFAICWDFFFPEDIRILREMGAEIIINPSAGFLEERSITRAVENGCYVVNAGYYPDNCLIVSPNGDIIAKGNEEDATGKIDLNKKYLTPYLSFHSYGEGRNIYHNERRPEMYHQIVKIKGNVKKA